LNSAACTHRHAPWAGRTTETPRVPIRSTQNPLLSASRLVLSFRQCLSVVVPRDAGLLLMLYTTGRTHAVRSHPLSCPPRSANQAFDVVNRAAVRLPGACGASSLLDCGSGPPRAVKTLGSVSTVPLEIRNAWNNARPRTRLWLLVALLRDRFSLA
jgi:hypothetical protein